MTKNKKDRTKLIRKERNRNKYQAAVRKKASLSKILKWDDPILKETCDPVNDCADAIPIINLMKEALLASDNGVGLAASQVGFSKRIISLRFNRAKPDIKIMINPVIMELSEEKQVYREGCLSYPDIYVDVERPKKITVEYEDINGDVHKEDFEDFEAVVICHEVDHTFGVCYVGQFWGEKRLKEIEFRKNRRKKRRI